MTTLPQEELISTPMPGPGARALAERARDAVPRAMIAAMPTFAVSTDRGILEDVDGNRLIDLGSGIGVTTVGGAAAPVAAAVRDQVDRLTHTSFAVTRYEGYIAVAERLNALTPGDFPKRTALFNSGAEAVENAVKLARRHTGRQAVVCFDHAFHGRTALTMGLTAKAAPYKAGFGPFPSELYRVPGSYPFRDGLDGREAAARTVARIEAQVGAEQVACLIIEPIQGEGGFIVPAPGFLQALQEWCASSGAVLIADEIQSGVARTGRWFACEHDGVVPDLVTIAKGVAGGLPLSAVTGRAEIMDCAGPGSLGGTYGGNPVACAAALAVIDTVRSQDLLVRVEQLGSAWARELAAVDGVNEVRGRGLLIGVGLAEGLPPAGEIAATLLAERGFIVNAPRPDTIRLAPPFILSDDDARAFTTTLSEVLARALSEKAGS